MRRTEVELNQSELNIHLGIVGSLDYSYFVVDNCIS